MLAVRCGSDGPNIAVRAVVPRRPFYCCLKLLTLKLLTVALQHIQG
jgi:hypothetical protein